MNSVVSSVGHCMLKYTQIKIGTLIPSYLSLNVDMRNLLNLCKILCFIFKQAVTHMRLQQLANDNDPISS